MEVAERRTPTRDDVMRESRFLLFFIGGMNLLFVIFAFTRPEPEVMPAQYAWSTAAIAAVYLLAAAMKSFWFRFVCVALWTTDILITNVVFQFNPLSLILMLIGLTVGYRMLKYRHVNGAPE